METLLMRYAESIGDRVRMARQEKRLTQAELANRIGAAQQTIGSLEAGKSNDSRKLPEIADALGVDVGYLKTGTKDPLPRIMAEAATTEKGYPLAEIYSALPRALDATITAAYKTLERRGENLDGKLDLIEHREFITTLIKVAIEAELTGDYLSASISR